MVHRIAEPYMIRLDTIKGLGLEKIVKSSNGKIKVVKAQERDAR